MNDKKVETLAYLLPITMQRLCSVSDVLAGTSRPERYLFYGLDYFHARGVLVFDNITLANKKIGLGLADKIICYAYNQLIKQIGGYAGSIEWIWPFRCYLRKATAWFVFSDRLIFPLLFMRKIGLVPKRPVILIPMGLPEKLAQVKNPTLLRQYVRDLNQLERIICVNAHEAEYLRINYGLVEPLRFVQTGVDTEYFCPQAVPLKVDVLSIGADPFRDFQTLVDAARMLPEYTFRVIAAKKLLEELHDIPGNVETLEEISMLDLREEIAACHMLALPVRENDFSGATTVLLQAMSMGKPVIANRVASNISGYDFENGKNCLFVKPGDASELATVIRRVRSDEDYRRRIGHSAREYVENDLGLERFHRRLFDIVSELCPWISDNNSMK